METHSLETHSQESQRLDTPAAGTDRWVEALVDCPQVQGVFTYQIPADLSVTVGDILTVPFGGQQVGAIALTLLNQCPPNLAPSQVKPVRDVVMSGFFPADYWQLLHQVADYYYTPLITVVKTALPPGLLGRSQRRIRVLPEAIPPGAEAFLRSPAQQLLHLLQRSKNGDYAWRYITKQLPQARSGLADLLQRGWVMSYLEPPQTARPKQQKAVTLVREPDPTDTLTDRQQQVLGALVRSGGDRWLSELLQQCRASSTIVTALEKKGFVVVQERENLRSDTGIPLGRDRPKALSPDQAAALAQIRQLEGAHTVLLHGVTGSGKTEVYLQAIEPILAQGRSALVLVPEIGLTPQLTDRFRQRFGSQVCVYHSALSQGERYDTWRQMLQGVPQVVIGTRSAIFAPLPQLGLIILDEEHDSSFKQTQPQPCYHARTVAQWRSQLAPCPLILGSATPALETWCGVLGARRAVRGEASRPGDGGEETQGRIPPWPRAQYVQLPQRIYDRPMPEMQVVDMRQEFHNGNRSILSRRLQLALGQLQERGEQGLIFVPRRGHSTFVSCRSCGEALNCPHCDVSLSHHQPQENAPSLLRCHYCNHHTPQPETCPHCGSPYLKFFGSGTQRVTQELSRLFPDLRWIRFDSDTTRTKGAHRALLTRFARGEADLLVGTQMLTKGIDLPQVTLVGVLAADSLFHLPDFRAGERACQTLIQVAGRSGRGHEPGRVLIQTYKPDHEVVQAVQTLTYDAFLARELAQRSPLAYPPYSRLILLRLSGLEADRVQATAELLGDRLRKELPEGVHLLGPAPAPILRVARRYRWQLLLKVALSGNPDISSPRLPIGALQQHCGSGVALTVDVDPLSLS